MVRNTDNLINEASKSLSLPTGKEIVIDIGTGDGRFVYQSARRNPEKFYIGVDANPDTLENVSWKIHKKAAKGGLPNGIFIQAAVEALPPELDGVAAEVHIHFPWGSLLRAVATGTETVLRGLRRICARSFVGGHHRARSYAGQSCNRRSWFEAPLERLIGKNVDSVLSGEWLRDLRDRGIRALGLPQT